MSEEKFDGKLGQASGKAKELVGKATKNEELQADGKAEQLIGKGKEEYGKAKDAVDKKLNEK